MDSSLKWKVVRIVLTTLYLLPGWILLTGTLAPYPLALGVLFSFAIACLTYSLFIDEQEAHRRSLLPGLHLLVFYLLLLVFKMYAASFKVLYNVLRGRINPRIVHFRTRLTSDIARLILSASITLTPGTITLFLDDDHLIVHWLDAKTTHSRRSGELIKGRMEDILKRIWV